MQGTLSSELLGAGTSPNHRDNLREGTEGSWGCQRTDGCTSVRPNEGPREKKHNLNIVKEPWVLSYYPEKEPENPWGLFPKEAAVASEATGSCTIRRRVQQERWALFTLRTELLSIVCDTQGHPITMDTWGREIPEMQALESKGKASLRIYKWGVLARQFQGSRSTGKWVEIADLPRISIQLTSGSKEAAAILLSARVWMKMAVSTHCGSQADRSPEQGRPRG